MSSPIFWQAQKLEDQPLVQIFHYPLLNEKHLCSKLSIKLQLGILEVTQTRSLEFQVQFCDSNVGTLQLMNWTYVSGRLKSSEMAM